MSEKRKIQRRMVEGATNGLRSGQLFDFVQGRFPMRHARRSFILRSSRSPIPT